MLAMSSFSMAALIAALLLSVCVRAMAGEAPVELLWPNGAPGAKGDQPADKPALTISLPPPEKANGAAVVICPGGGYGALMMTYEGVDIAKWLNEQGVAGIVLQYRIHPYQHPAPLLDAQRALRTVRANAAKWHIDPARIGIMGFSAGGHVAATLGTHYDAGDPKSADPIERVSCRPDFLLLIYPVITMGPATHAGSKENLLGKNPSPELIDLLSNEKHVTAQTPPAFLAHSEKDSIVSVEDSVLFYNALKAQHVPVEFLKLPTGDHGLGCGKGPEWTEWQAKCLAWLKQMKFMDKR